MNIERYEYRVTQVMAVRVPGDGAEQEAIAERFNGAVKGTMLQPVDRVIEFWNHGDERTAKVGDWVVVTSEARRAKIAIYADADFGRTFTPARHYPPMPTKPTEPEALAILRDLTQHASEEGDHTLRSFNTGIVRLANRAHKVLAEQATLTEGPSKHIQDITRLIMAWASACDTFKYNPSEANLRRVGVAMDAVTNSIQNIIDERDRLKFAAEGRAG